jgi:hypothetical protein
MNNIIFKKYSISKTVFSLLIYTIFFPFVPGVIPGSDTQPFFLIYYLLFNLIILNNVKLQQEYFMKYSNMFLPLAFVLLTSIILINANSIVIDKMIYWTRFISFVQFTFAIFFGVSSKCFFTEKTFIWILCIYLFMTFIYFISNGYIENALIPSRNDSFDTLTSTGRGARTLSPEPSFFALHIFNLYLIYKLLFKNNSVFDKWVFYLVSACLILSLSGYGFLLLFALIIVRYPVRFFIFSIVSMVMSGFWVSYLESFQNFRSISLLVSIFKNDPLIVLKADRSFDSRISSFNKYIESISDNFLVGDSFSLFEGGGFISVISAFGFLGIVFFIFFLVSIFISNLKLDLKFLLVLWFIISFMSGPIGIPTIGLIVGLVIRTNKLTLIS